MNLLIPLYIIRVFKLKINYNGRPGFIIVLLTEPLPSSSFRHPERLKLLSKRKALCIFLRFSLIHINILLHLVSVIPKIISGE
jgi:hypothetical protein